MRSIDDKKRVRSKDFKPSWPPGFRNPLLDQSQKSFALCFCRIISCFHFWKKLKCHICSQCCISHLIMSGHQCGQFTNCLFFFIPVLQTTGKDQFSRLFFPNLKFLPIHESNPCLFLFGCFPQYLYNLRLLRCGKDRTVFFYNSGFYCCDFS